MGRSAARTQPNWHSGARRFGTLRRPVAIRRSPTSTNRTRIGRSTLREQAFAKRAPRAIHALPPTETAEDRQKIKEFIDAPATRSITPQDVASHLHVSRQLLDLRFHESGTGTVGALITARKLAEVKRLLIQTTASIAQITDLCGFANENALKNLFKRTTGLSMRDWRRQQT